MSILASLGFPLLLAVVVSVLVALRAMMARGMMKVRALGAVVGVLVRVGACVCVGERVLP
jgi:hypothetical protein